MLDRIYTGIGSRQTPDTVCDDMRVIAAKLADAGWLLRSGGAPGADSAWADGAKARQTPPGAVAFGRPDPQGRTGKAPVIILPHEGFNNQAGIVLPKNILADAEPIAASFHPNWSACNAFARKAHSRNVPQVLGPDLATPSTVVLAWTPDAATVGGTATALRIATFCRIPILNLADPRCQGLASLSTEALDTTVFAIATSWQDDLAQQITRAGIAPPRLTDSRELVLWLHAQPWNTRREVFHRLAIQEATRDATATRDPLPTPRAPAPPTL